MHFVASSNLASLQLIVYQSDLGKDLTMRYVQLLGNENFPIVFEFTTDASNGMFDSCDFNYVESTFIVSSFQLTNSAFMDSTTGITSANSILFNNVTGESASLDIESKTIQLVTMQWSEGEEFLFLRFSCLAGTNYYYNYTFR